MLKFCSLQLSLVMPARSQSCMLPPAAFCCGHHAYPGAQDHSLDLPVGQDGESQSPKQLQGAVYLQQALCLEKTQHFGAIDVELADRTPAAWLTLRGLCAFMGPPPQRPHTALVSQRCTPLLVSEA